MKSDQTKEENKINLDELIKSYLALFDNNDVEIRDRFGSDIYFKNIELFQKVRDWYETAVKKENGGYTNKNYQALLRIFTTGSNGTPGGNNNPLDYQIREHFKIQDETKERIISANQQGGSFVELIKIANKIGKDINLKLDLIISNEYLPIKNFIDKLRKSFEKNDATYKFISGGLFQNTSNVGKELNYLLNFKQDNMRLINGCYLNAIRIIHEIENNINKKPTQEEEDSILKVLCDKIKEWKEGKENTSKYKVVPTYYLIDQLFNVIDKITKQKVDKLPQEENQDGDVEKIKTFYNNCYSFCMQSKFYRNKNDLMSSLIDNKNTILYGPPGTGKTFQVIEFLKEQQEYIQDDELYKYVVFHPTYSYEDFIDGIKPVGVSKEGQIELKVINGNFKDFCISVHKRNKKFIAEGNKELTKYYFIVDEVNRANLSAVFGETLMLLENSYRYKYFDDNGKITPKKNKANNCLITLQNSPVIKKVTDGNETEKDALIFEEIDGENYFGVPENIYFIGMMNNVDKSIDAFDLALRRRFKWIEKGYEESVIQEVLEGKIDTVSLKEYKSKINDLNKFISEDLRLGNSYTFGHSFFLKITNYCKGKIENKHLKSLFEDHLKPTLREYLRTILEEGKEIETELNNALGKFLINAKATDNTEN